MSTFGMLQMLSKDMVDDEAVDHQWFLDVNLDRLLARDGMRRDGEVKWEWVDLEDPKFKHMWFPPCDENGEPIPDAEPEPRPIWLVRATVEAVAA